MRIFYLKIYVVLTPNLFVQKGFEKEKNNDKLNAYSEYAFSRVFLVEVLFL